VLLCLQRDLVYDDGVYSASVCVVKETLIP
jgi:hypothetical protein